MMYFGTVSELLPGPPPLPPACHCGPASLPRSVQCATTAEPPRQLEPQERSNELVLEHLALVRAVAARLRTRLPAHLEFDDLVQAGVLGLLEAARKFDPEMDVSFATYATHRVRGAILDNLRGLDPASRKLRRKHRRLEQVRHDLAQELQRDPTEAEIADRSGMDLEGLRSLVLDIHLLNGVGAPEGAGGCNSIDNAPDSGVGPEVECVRRARARVLKEAMVTLPDAYKLLMLLHYANDLTLKRIGEALGVSERNVSRMHNRALRRVGAILAARGIRSSQEI